MEACSGGLGRKLGARRAQLAPSEQLFLASEDKDALVNPSSLDDICGIASQSESCNLAWTNSSPGSSASDDQGATTPSSKRTSSEWVRASSELSSSDDVAALHLITPFTCSIDLSDSAASALDKRALWSGGSQRYSTAPDAMQAWMEDLGWEIMASRPRMSIRSCMGSMSPLTLCGSPQLVGDNQPDDLDTSDRYTCAADLMRRIGYNLDYLNVLKVDKVRSCAK